MALSEPDDPKPTGRERLEMKRERLIRKHLAALAVPTWLQDEEYIGKLEDQILQCTSLLEEGGGYER